MAITINGTTGVAGVDGSASTPALQGSDTNTGVSFGTDIVNINTGGSTKATVDASGKVGIGTTSPVGKLTVDENNASEHFQLRNTTNTSNFAALGVDSSFNLRVYTNGTNERMRIDSSGNVLVHATSDSSSSDAGFKILDWGSNGTWISHVFNSGTATNSPGPFLYNLNGSYSGTRFYPRVDGGLANYQSNNANLCDERAKEDIVDLDDQWSTVKQ